MSKDHTKEVTRYLLPQHKYNRLVSDIADQMYQSQYDGVPTWITADDYRDEAESVVKMHFYTLEES